MSLSLSPNKASKPTPVQRLFTDGRPYLFGIAAGALLGTTAVMALRISNLDGSPSSVLLLIGLSLAGALLGGVVGGILGGMVLGVVHLWVEHRNGGPFQVGDTVVILSRRFPGRVSRVYEVWPSRSQVRVELGDGERQDVKDVFSYADVRRCTAGPSSS